MVAYLHTLRKLGHDARLFFLAHFLIGLSYSGIYVVLFNLYLLRLGYETDFIGWVNGVALLIHALLCIPAGLFGQRWGARRGLVAGAAVAGIGLGLVPLAEAAPALWQAGWLIVTYTLAWSGASLYLVNFPPFLVEVTETQARNHAFSVAAALIAVAAFSGSLLGGLLPGLFAAVLQLSTGQPAPYRYALLLAAVLFLCSVPVLLRTQKESSVAQHHGLAGIGTAQSAPYALIGLIALVSLLRASGEGAGVSFFNVYLDSGLATPTAFIGMIVATGQLLAIPAVLLLPLWIDRWGQGWTIVTSCAGVALSLILLAWIPHWSTAAFAYMSLVALTTVARSALVIYSQAVVGPRWRSTLSGVIAMTAGGSLAAMAVGGGYLIAGIGYATLFWLGAVLAATGALLFAVYLLATTWRVRRATLPS